MSLALDTIFIAAIKTDSDIMQAIGNRLYSTAIPLPDEDIENVPVPYVIVTFDGLTNDQGTKDDPYESMSDKVTIGIDVTAPNRTALADLTKAIRKTIHTYFMENQTAVDDYQLSAQAVQYDSMKPCYWQALSYLCDVENTNDEDDEQE